MNIEKAFENIDELTIEKNYNETVEGKISKEELIMKFDRDKNALNYKVAGYWDYGDRQTSSTHETYYFYEDGKMYRINAIEKKYGVIETDNSLMF